MTKDRDWVDYVNLGSNIFQNLQLSGVHDKLGAMASIAARDQAVAATEDKFRDVVFQADSALRNMRALLQEDRRGVLALLKESLLNFKRYEISSAVFRAYGDKERLRAVLEGYEALAQECSAGLPPAERDEAELCAKYHVEQADLNMLIETQQQAEELDRAKAELTLLRGRMPYLKAGPAKAIAILLLGTFFVLLGTGGPIAEALSDPGHALHFQSTEDLMTALVIIIGLSGLGWPFLILAFRRLLVEYSQKPKFREAREALSRGPAVEAKIKELEEETRIGTYTGLLESLQDRFGSKPVEELVKIRAERDALIAKVLKVGKEQEI